MTDNCIFKLKFNMKYRLILFALFFSSVVFSQEKPHVVGGDRDNHGCVGSAGYTYSQIKNDCIRVFEQKIKLKEVKPSKDYETSAAVILSNDKKKAEIFLADEKESVILKKIGKSKVWKNKIYTLTPNKKGYELKKGKNIIYR